MNCLSVVILTVAVLGLVEVNSTTNIVLSCHFNIIPTPGNETQYACNLYNLNVTIKNVQIDAFNGTHLPGKNDSDVTQIQFHNGTMLYVPNGIGSLFENLKRLIVGDPLSFAFLGTKALTRLNLKNMSNLQVIAFESNDVKKLDKDALWDLFNLKVIYLTAQRLTFLNVRTFERNGKLTTVYISSTELRYLHENLFIHNFLLEGIVIENSFIEWIDTRTFARNSKLRAVSLRSNKLKYLPESLFEKNPSLRQVDFSDNSLHNIQIDFTTIKEILFVNFEHNHCIDAIYDKNDPTRAAHGTIFKNLTQFQDVIQKNCSSNEI